MSRLINIKSVLTVPNTSDCMGDVLSLEKIEEEFNLFNGIKDINLEHNGLNIKAKLTGSNLLYKEELINGILYPKGTWIVQISSTFEPLIDSVINGQLNGLSLEYKPFNMDIDDIEYLNDLYIQREIDYGFGFINLSDYQERNIEYHVSGFGIVEYPCVYEALFIEVMIEDLDVEDEIYEEFFMINKSVPAEKVSLKNKVSSQLKVSKMHNNICLSDNPKGLETQSIDIIYVKKGIENKGEVNKKMSLLDKFKKFIGLKTEDELENVDVKDVEKFLSEIKDEDELDDVNTETNVDTDTEIEIETNEEDETNEDAEVSVNIETEEVEDDVELNESEELNDNNLEETETNVDSTLSEILDTQTVEVTKNNKDVLNSIFGESVEETVVEVNKSDFKTIEQLYLQSLNIEKSNKIDNVLNDIFAPKEKSIGSYKDLFDK